MGTVHSGPAEYCDCIDALRAENAELAEEVASFHGIGHVLDWMKEKSMTANVIDMVGQDEFEYDFMIQLAPSDRWLVFGVT
jgi:hypothetical protein